MFRVREPVYFSIKNRNTVMSWGVENQKRPKKGKLLGGL